MNKKTNNKKSSAISLIILFVVALIFICGYFLGVKTTATESSIDINAFLYRESVSVSDISEITINENINYGQRTNGADFISVKSGNFKNELFGNYRCSVYTSSDFCIAIKKNDGKYVVFNAKTNEDTKQLYDSLIALY